MMIYILRHQKVFLTIRKVYLIENEHIEQYPTICYLKKKYIISDDVNKEILDVEYISIQIDSHTMWIFLRNSLGIVSLE